MNTEIVGQPMSDAEALEDVAVSLADEICDGEDIARQKRIRKLLIEFANENLSRSTVRRCEMSGFDIRDDARRDLESQGAFKTSPHPFRPMCGTDTCWECDEHVYAAIHQPPLPKWIKCANGHVLEPTDAYRFVTCPWCHSNLIVQW